MKNQLKITDENTVSNAFVMYLAIFPLPTILDSSDEVIADNIRRTENDLLVSGALDRVSFLDSAGEEKKPETSFWDIFAPKAKKYTESSPLCVGFVYDEDIETSRWSDSHEAGRLYVESVNGKNVVTKVYVASLQCYQGRMYEASFLMGSWNLQEATNKQKAMSYWFGLSTGVVDIRTKGFPIRQRSCLDS